MKVADCMTPKPACVTPDDGLGTARALMDAKDCRTVPVTKNGKLVGIITDRDIRKHWEKFTETNVGAALTAHPICISADESVAEAVRMLLAHKVGGLPVMRKQKFVGIITTTDILKAVLGLPQLEK